MHTHRARSHCNTCLPYTLTLQHVPALHAPTRACLLTHARTRTHTHAQQCTSLRGSRPSLSCLFGGRDPLYGVSVVYLMRALLGKGREGELQDRERGGRRDRDGGADVCVCWGARKTDPQRQPLLERPRGRQPGAPCSPSWAPRV